MLLLLLGMTALWAVAALSTTGVSLSGWNAGSFLPETVPPAKPAVQPFPPDLLQARADREAIADLIGVYQRKAGEAWTRRLADSIYRESRAASVDPLMVASIIATESSFRSRAVSRAGAVGLMQLRPFVARQVAHRSEVEWNGMETLYAPEHNLRLGVRYYKELLERFHGDHEVALTAYNYGPTRVSRQLTRGTFGGSSYAAGILERYEWMNRQRSL
jgi:soluble lytic murein transglycosylase-like protein